MQFYDDKKKKYIHSTFGCKHLIWYLTYREFKWLNKKEMDKLLLNSVDEISSILNRIKVRDFFEKKIEKKAPVPS